MQTQEGKFNFPQETLKNPETGEKIDKWYGPGETYDSKFTSLASSYEECRAECVGLYLSCDNKVLNIFGMSSEASNTIYVNWLSLVHAAVKGIEMYSPGTKEWKQAHSQARFVILNVLLEEGEGFVSIKEAKNEEDGKPDLLLTMDRKKLESVGKPAIGAFLKKLQLYKSMGDFKSASAMYEKYSAVSEEGPTPWAKWRDIIIDRKVPRKILVQANTKIDGEKLVLKDYSSDVSGMIESWRERFSSEESQNLDVILESLYLKDKPHFP